MDTVLQPFKLNSKIMLDNSLAVAPMTTSQSNSDGTVSEAESIWLERLAFDGYGLIITCAASISSTAIAFKNQLSIADDDKLPGLTQLAKRLSRYKSVVLVQLCHGGSRTIKELTGSDPYSASSYTMSQIPNFVPPKTLSLDQIGGIIDDFAKACGRVEKAGFAGVELHGANGYLFTQFISKMTNMRNDEFGGNLENRARFAREVIRACRKEISEDFIIGFRMSFENAGLETGLDIDENIQIINWLFKDGINYAHVSHMNYKANSVKYPDKIALQYIRKGIGPHASLIAAGNVTSLDDAEKAIACGANIVALGRAAIGNEKIPELFVSKKPVPSHTPYLQKDLLKLGVSKEFINYMKTAIPISSFNIVN
jgi:2,4-dienoyl-CoA reductase-like NADH-dependent reductase (Old Yellow Enzyme family)